MCLGIILTGMLLFIAIIFLVLGVDLEYVLRKMIRSPDHRKKRMPELDNRRSVLGKIVLQTEIMIQRSNIRMLVSYNVWAHFFICLTMGIVSFLWIHKYLEFLTSLAFSVVTLLIPYTVLQIITDHFTKKEKKNSINFLIILKNFFVAGKNDVFEAFEKAKEYIAQPLKSHIEIMVYEYKHKVNAVVCLENLKMKLGTPELKLYLDNLAICYIQGGDIKALTETFIQELSSTDEEDDRQDMKDKLLNYGLYLLLAFNFLIIYWMVSSIYRTEILGSLWGQFVFVLDMAVCIYIIYMSLKRN